MITFMDLKTERVVSLAADSIKALEEYRYCVCDFCKSNKPNGFEDNDPCYTCGSNGRESSTVKIKSGNKWYFVDNEVFGCPVSSFYSSGEMHEKILLAIENNRPLKLVATEEEMEAHKEKMEREEMEWKKEHPGTKRRL